MLMPAFHKFAAEASIISRLLAGFAELEILLLHCISQARDDFDATLKAMFRTRGETNRINVADALGRQLYRNEGLEAEFALAISDMRYCLKIRNQYAHCNWYDDNSGRLAFVNVEEIAEKNLHLTGFDELTRYYIDVPTLEAQEQFYTSTIARLEYVNFERRFRTGQLSSQVFAEPPEMKRPPLHAA